MTNLTLKQLRYFDAVIRCGHFGRAAADCSISQPALSLQIKEMETVLGAPLLERGGRAVRPTQLGAALAPRVRDILRALEELDELARETRNPLGGALRIGVIPTIAPYLLPAVITTLAAHFPQVDLRPREAVTQKLIADVCEGHLDMALLALPVSEPALHEEPLFAEEFRLVRPDCDADAPVPPPDLLREMRLLLLEEGHCFRDQALSYCGGAPEARAMMEGSALSTLVQMVGARIGVTLIPDMAVAIETRSAPVAVARLAPPRPTRRIGLVWRRSSPFAAQFTRIGGLIKALPRPGGDAI